MKKNYLIDLDTIYENLQGESVRFLTEMIEKANRKIKTAIEADDKNRTNGMSYQLREEMRDRMNGLEKLVVEYRAFLKKGVRPLKEWFDGGDLESLEDNGYKRYVFYYFRRMHYQLSKN